MLMIWEQVRVERLEHLVFVFASLMSAEGNCTTRYESVTLPMGGIVLSAHSAQSQDRDYDTLH